MVIINILAPEQEPLRETLEDIFNINTADLEDDGRYRRAVTTTEMPTVTLDPLESLCLRATNGKWSISDHFKFTGEEMDGSWEMEIGAHYCYLVLVLVLTAITLSLLITSPLVWGLVYYKFVRHLRARDVERQEAQDVADNVEWGGTQKTPQRGNPMTETRKETGTRRKSKTTSSKAIPEGRRTRTLNDFPMDRSSSLSSQQEKPEGYQGKPRQPSRKELLNKTVTEWMQGEEDGYMQMRQMARDTGDMGVMETSFCVADKDWVHCRLDQISSEAPPTGTVARMEQDRT